MPKLPKLKLSRRQLTWLAVAVLVVIAVVVSRARGGAEDTKTVLDDAATRTCGDFATGYPHASTKAERLSLADKVNASSVKTANDAIGRRASEMGRAAGDGGTEWKKSADALTAACRDAGWAG